MKSKQEEADQDQETPKLDVTKESTEDKNQSEAKIRNHWTINTSELSECNVSSLGELNQNSWKPHHSKAKSKSIGIQNQKLIKSSQKSIGKLSKNF